MRHATRWAQRTHSVTRHAGRLCHTPIRRGERSAPQDQRRTRGDRLAESGRRRTPLAATWRRGRRSASSGDEGNKHNQKSDTALGTAALLSALSAAATAVPALARSGGSWEQWEGGGDHRAERDRVGFKAGGLYFSTTRAPGRGASMPVAAAAKSPIEPPPPRSRTEERADGDTTDDRHGRGHRQTGERRDRSVGDDRLGDGLCSGDLLLSLRDSHTAAGVSADIPSVISCHPPVRVRCVCV